jgi:hypothetical protein
VTTSSPCFELRTHLAALLVPDSPIVDRLLLAACVAAQTCRSLSVNDLRNCAAKLFDVSPEGELAGAFVTAYEHERDAMAAQRQIGMWRAMKA